MSLTIPTKDELESYKIIATIAASNAHWKKLGGGGKPEEVIATILSIMLMARELGVQPMQAISGGINNILGKFEISARIMNMLMRKHGHAVQVKMLTDQVCKVWGKRKDTGEEMEATYHIEEAARAGLIKEGGGWKKNPQDMLFARAISRLARRLTPDCIGGCYVEGELQETALKQPAQAPEMPAIDISPSVFEPAKPVKQLLSFEIPADIEESSLEQFMQESAETNETTTLALAHRANKNPEKFISVLREWEDKRHAPVAPSGEEIEVIDV